MGVLDDEPKFTTPAPSALIPFAFPTVPLLTGPRMLMTLLVAVKVSLIDVPLPPVCSTRPLVAEPKVTFPPVTVIVSVLAVVLVVTPPNVSVLPPPLIVALPCNVKAPEPRFKLLLPPKAMVFPDTIVMDSPRRR